MDSLRSSWVTMICDKISIPSSTTYLSILSI
ncbi:hypothetical protein [Shigella phage ESh22]|nr:hypothetical protein [Shigella phage ESh22]